MVAFLRKILFYNNREGDTQHILRAEFAWFAHGFRGEGKVFGTTTLSSKAPDADLCGLECITRWRLQLQDIRWGHGGAAP